MAQSILVVSSTRETKMKIEFTEVEIKKLEAGETLHVVIVIETEDISIDIMAKEIF